MLGTNKQYTILEVAKMFKHKIKFLPPREGERFGTIIPNNNAFKFLGYRAKIDIKNYINSFLKAN